MRALARRSTVVLVAGILASASLAVVSTPVPSAGAAAGAAFESVPPSVDPSRKYLFYLHQLLLEMRGRNAVHPTYGRAQYDDIIKAFVDRGFVVISEVRPRGTERIAYAQKIKGQVRALLAARVPPENITVAGFSRGGTITLIASAELGQPQVNFVVMAGCWRAGAAPRADYEREILQNYAPLLTGRILSIFDEADTEARDCQEAFGHAVRFEQREIVVSTRLGHGLFFAPRSEWLDPAIAWANGR